MVKVSIIMPVYNASRFLKMSCGSVAKQTLKDVELICVDDGSTDDSLEILNTLKEKFDFIKIFTQKNQGSGYARNNGMSKAQGEYIAFLDADDIFVEEDALEKMYFYGSKNSADIVCGNLKRIRQNGDIETNYDFKNTKFAYFNKKDVVLPIEYGIPFAFYRNIFKREFLEKHEIIFPDLIRGQDPIFLANALVNTDELYVLRVDLYGYNHSVGGGVNIKVNTYEKKIAYIQHFKNTFDILKDNEFESPFAAYKREFMDYILFQNNLYDEDIKKAVREVFSDGIDEYFTKDDYGYSYLEMIVNDEEDTDFDTFGEIKEYLLKETLLNDNFIDVNYLREYVKLLDENEDNVLLLEKTSMNKVKEIESEINEDYEFLSKNFETLNEDFNLVKTKYKAKQAKKEEAIKNEIPEEINEKTIEEPPEKENRINKFLKTIKHFHKE